eukprot:15268560-Heterocapsa_arctica.AAC.1
MKEKDLNWKNKTSMERAGNIWIPSEQANRKEAALRARGSEDIEERSSGNHQRKEEALQLVHSHGRQHERQRGMQICEVSGPHKVHGRVQGALCKDQAAIVESIMGMGTIYATKGHEELEDIPDIINQLEKHIEKFQQRGLPAQEAQSPHHCRGGMERRKTGELSSTEKDVFHHK